MNKIKRGEIITGKDERESCFSDFVGRESRNDRKK